MEKCCTRCKEIKDVSEFASRSDNNKPRAFCRECNRIYNREIYNREIYKNKTDEVRQKKHKLKIDGKKKCNKCKEIKNTSEFQVRSKENDILWYCCKDCKRIYDREYHSKRPKKDKKRKYVNSKLNAERKKKWICDYLRKEKCKDCGEEDVVVLTFDHLGNKKYNVSDMIRLGHSIKSMEEEIKKCEVVCANCHMRRTAKKFGWYKLKY